uniref:PAK1 interacting protein 1 n=1 Tax=Cyprinus carpio TaxID=7962 RepID=A0A8C0YPD7_CYPCA
MPIDFYFNRNSYYEISHFRWTLKERSHEWAIEFKLTHHAHTASLASVSSSDQFIATGSKDETIQLYDMNKKTEHGALLHHNGTRVSCLEFYGMSHLLSGGQDGLICVWSTKKWECLKSFKNPADPKCLSSVKLTQSGFYLFRGHVTSLSVHPSGKLVLSVGTDKTLQQKAAWFESDFCVSLNYIKEI